MARWRLSRVNSWAEDRQLASLAIQTIVSRAVTAKSSIRLFPAGSLMGGLAFIGDVHGGLDHLTVVMDELRGIR